MIPNALNVTIGEDVEVQTAAEAPTKTFKIELNAVVGKSYHVFSSEIKRVITEALLADSRITDVTDFEVAQINKRTASVKFTAETIFGEIPIESEVNANV